MAIHSADCVGYFLTLPVEQLDLLGAIRHWDNLQIGLEGETIWVKGFTPVQLDSLEVKTIPAKELYYTSGTQLFRKGSRLPHRTVPCLEWAPISKGLAAELPLLNHNYFGVGNRVHICLRHTEEEKEPAALLVSLPVLKSYIETAPAIRLQSLHWVILNSGHAFIIGSPLLPLQGEAYWKADDFFLPAGYAFELPVLTDILQQMLNPKSADWIVWTKEGQYATIAKDRVRSLSIFSVRKTVKA